MWRQCLNSGNSLYTEELGKLPGRRNMNAESCRVSMGYLDEMCVFGFVHTVGHNYSRASPHQLTELGRL